jgi:hypothetical protein
MRLRTLTLGTLAATAISLTLAGTANAATPTHRDDTTVRCDEPDYRIDPDDDRAPRACTLWRTESRGHEWHTRACDRVEAVPARPGLVVPAEPTEPRLVVPAIPRDR